MDNCKREQNLLLVHVRLAYHVMSVVKLFKIKTNWIYMRKYIWNLNEKNVVWNIISNVFWKNTMRLYMEVWNSSVIASIMIKIVLLMINASLPMKTRLYASMKTDVKEWRVYFSVVKPKMMMKKKQWWWWKWEWWR